MPRPCTVCRHPQRLQIEQALVTGISLRDIAGRYGTAKTIIARHRSHVASAIEQRKQALESARTGTLLEDVRAGEGRAERLYARAEEILASALQDKDRRTALQAIRTAVDVMGEARGYLELRGELTHELGRDRSTTIMAIQILGPSNTSEQGVRVSFAMDRAEFEEEQIGLVQRRRQRVHELFACAVGNSFGQVVEQNMRFAVEGAIALLDRRLSDSLRQVTFDARPRAPASRAASNALPC